MIKSGLKPRWTGTTAIAVVMAMKAIGFEHPAVAHASMTQKDLKDAIKTYQIPQGSMEAALNQLAEVSGVRMIYRSHLTEKLRTPGLVGNYTLAGALDALLSGTGLNYRLSENGEAVSVVLAEARNTVNDATPAGAQKLPTIEVGSAKPKPAVQARSRGAENSSGSQGQASSYAQASGAPALGGRLTGYNATSAPTTLKTNTPLMQMPVSVEVVTRQTMDDQQAITVRDAIVSNVSGVIAQPNFFDALKVRGFSTFGSTYKNGLQEYRSRYLDTTNLQSIEVLKGPAAMLFGRMEPGGVVNLVVKRPLETPYFSVEQQVGNYGFTRTTIDATGPLTADKSVLYRFNGEFFNTNSYRDFARDRATFIAPTITLHPVEQFRMNIDFEYHNRTWVENSELYPAIGGSPANIPISRYLHPASITTAMPDHTDRKRIAYDWTYDFAPDWSLTNRLSYQNTGTRTINAFSSAINQATGVMTRLLNVNPGFTDRLFSTNLVLNGKVTTGPLNHSVLIGYDFFNYYTPLQIQNNAIPIAPINIYAPNYFDMINPYRNPRYSRNGQGWSGVFGQDMISFLDDSVHVLLGGRYDWAKTSSAFFQNSPYDVDRNYKSYYDKAFSPRVGLVLQPRPWLSFYGSFTQSFGANQATPGGAALPPQKGEQWEGGVKVEFFDKRLTATVAYFDITKTNISTTNPTDPNNPLLIGKALSKGVEFDLTGQVTDNWSVIANYTHDDVRTVQGALVYNPLTLITTQTPVAGKVLPGLPRNYGNIWLKYEADGDFKGLSLGGGVSAYSSALGDNANSFVLPGYALLNGMIAYRTTVGASTVTAQLNVKNLTDVTYYAGSNSNLQILTGTPRTFLGSLRVEF